MGDSTLAAVFVVVIVVGAVACVAALVALIFGRNRDGGG
jgi:hypothetical protein